MTLLSLEPWRAAAQRFFDERARQVGGSPSVEELCFISGREPRIWARADAFGEMVDSIVDLTGVGAQSRVLEVGCAAGFIARGVAPRVAQYVGVDIADSPLGVARRIGLANADFRHADATALPDRDASFDAAFAYDVLTNFPSFAAAETMLLEMLRVVRPGGRVLLGSIPDAAREAEMADAVNIVQGELDARYGPPWTPPLDRPSLLMRGLLRFALRRPAASDPGRIVCYYFERSAFQRFAAERGALDVFFAPVHPLNPFAKFRFNAVLARPTPSRT